MQLAQKQILFWIIMVALTVAVIGLLKDIILPFVAGMGVAYFLSPSVDRLQAMGLSRVVGTALVIGFVTVLLGVALVFVVPLLIDQLRHIYIDGELEPIDAAVYFNRLYQKNYTIALNATGSAVDDPDQHFAENYGCGAPRNFNAYCSPQLTELIAAQSRERDIEKRRAIVRDIERKLVEDTVRPIITHSVAAGCWQPQVKGLTIMVNSIYNGWRFEDIWLDK